MERKIKFAPEEYYHLYSRGVEKRKIFIRHQDYQRFIALLYIMNQEGPFNFANFLKSNKLGEVFNETKGKALVSISSPTCSRSGSIFMDILIYSFERLGYFY